MAGAWTVEGINPVAPPDKGHLRVGWLIAPLVSHFFHTGLALSDFNSLGSLISNPITSSSGGATTSASGGHNPNIQTNANPSGSTTTTTSNPTNASSTTSTVSRVVAGASLPAPVACSPFSKDENHIIELAWQTLHADQNSNSISQTKSFPFGSSGLTNKQTFDPNLPHPSKKSSLPRLEAHLEFEPKSGKAKLAQSETQPNHDDDDNASLTLDNQAIASDEFDNQDAVLNLSMEDHPYIIPVGLDSLFTVDVRRLKLYPAFWHGPHLDVYKGKWFYPTTSKRKQKNFTPVILTLQTPWKQHMIKLNLGTYPMKSDELRSALKIGTEAEDKLKVHLKEFDYDVIFQTATQGRLYSTAVSSRISKTILTNFFTSISKKTAGYSGGTVVIRGWDQVQSWSGLESQENLTDQQETSSDNTDQVVGTSGATGFNTTADMIQEEDLENPHAEVSDWPNPMIHLILFMLAINYASSVTRQAPLTGK
ncbi:uncharacterized protein VP01_4253g1 [Puccinia sorghi]|uniref:C20G8.02-like WWE domain-containing protein n=1 Tax=Puccinia sorghi TaxID=27349 RepID=A0A0L6USC8_9BASI|nr:uncharacterized protein VP01_4253g1 [Puccinia sorghi]